MPLEGDSEEKGEYAVWHPPLGVSSESHRLGAPVLGSYTGERSPIGWLENHWDLQEGCGKPRLCLWGACMLWLSPEAEHRMWLKNCSNGCRVSHDCFVLHPSLNQVNTLAVLMPCHTAALGLGWSWLGRRHGGGTQKLPGPRPEPGWGGSSHCWHLFKQHFRRNLDLWWQPLDHSSYLDIC